MERGQYVAEVDDAPELEPWLRRVYDAFWQLDTERHLGGFGSGRIPWSKVEEWLDRGEVDDADERDWFSTLIRRLDAEYSRLQEKKREKKQAPPKAPPTRGRG